MTVVINGTTGITNDGGYTGDGVVFADTTPANTLVTTTGGNVGIGTSSPAQKLDVQSSSGGTTARFRNSSGNFIDFIETSGSTRQGYIGTTDGTNWTVHNDKNGYIAFDTNNTERARFTNSGNFSIFKTLASETPSTGSGFGFADAADPFFSIVNANASGVNANIYLSKRTTGTIVSINNNNGTSNTGVGSISITASSTAYNTSSDYRLKESIQPMQNALAKVAALKPVTYKWKADGSDGEGFIAHELQEVVPDCVTGEKDAVDADGNPVYQGIDTSFLVATLTAAIQEQQAIIQQLQADLAALKGA